MELINNETDALLTPHDLAFLKQQKGFEQYVYDAVGRFGWKSIKENGQIKIYYSSIPQRTQNQLVNPNTGQVLTFAALRDYIKTQEEKHTKARLESFLPTVPKKIREEVHNYEVQKEEINEQTGEVLMLKRGFLPQNEINTVLRKYQYFSALALEPSRREVKDWGFQNLEKMRNFICHMARAEGIEMPTNYRWLQIRIADFKQKGWHILIDQRIGNRNASKLGIEQKRLLEQLYGNGLTKPNFEQVWEAYHRTAIAKGWEKVEISTVQRYLNSEGVRQRMHLARHGKAEFQNELMYRITREKVQKSNHLWVTDGTKVNYYYTKNGKLMAKLNVYAVVDAHSAYILGWHLTEQAESAETVQHAMRQAIRASEMRMPKQILYDNGSANIAAFKVIQDALHFPAAPNNAPSKMIERLFYEIQRQVQGRQAYFTGQNITAKSQDSRVNKEKIQALLKAGQIPDFTEVLRQAEMDKHLWNNTPGKDGQTPKQKYFENLPDNLQTITKRDLAGLFWKTHIEPVTYRNIGLRTQINGKVYIFEKLDQKNEPDIGFMNKIGEVFTVKYNPEDFSEVAVYDTKGEFVAFLVEKEKMPHAIADYQEGDRQKINVRLRVQKEQINKVQSELNDLHEGMDFEERLKLGHRFLNKNVLEAAENDYYTMPARSESLTVGLTQNPNPTSDLRSDFEESESGEEKLMPSRRELLRKRFFKN